MKNRITSLLKNLPNSALKESKYHMLKISQPIHPSALEIFERIGAHNQITLNYPFFDRRIIEFCLALPADQKLRNGMNRSIVRRALSNHLPPSIINRRQKTSYRSSVRNAFANNEGWLLSAVDDFPQNVYNFVDKDFLTRVLHKYHNQPTASKDIESQRYLFTITTFIKWMESIKGDNQNGRY